MASIFGQAVFYWAFSYDRYLLNRDYHRALTDRLSFKFLSNIDMVNVLLLQWRHMSVTWVTWKEYTSIY